MDSLWTDEWMHKPDSNRPLRVLTLQPTSGWVRGGSNHPLQINRNGTASQYFTSLGLPFNERNYTWSANGNQLTYHHQDSTDHTGVMEYSISGDSATFIFPPRDMWWRGEWVLGILEEKYIRLE